MQKSKNSNPLKPYNYITGSTETKKYPTPLVKDNYFVKSAS